MTTTGEENQDMAVPMCSFMVCHCLQGNLRTINEFDTNPKRFRLLRWKEAMIAPSGTESGMWLFAAMIACILATLA